MLNTENMLTSTQIQNIIQQYGDSLFPFGMSKYFTQNNKVIWGLLMDAEKKKFHHLFGSIEPIDMAQFNSSFSHSIAGYKVNAREKFPSLTADADIFLISKQCLDFPLHDVVALVVHELCHWYIDSGLQSKHPIAISDTDKIKGRGLYRKTDQENEHITKHDRHFCDLLCAVATRAVNTFSVFSSREALIASAMKFDIH